MTVRMGANGMPMPEKQETLQEILEVNPNAKKKKKVEETQILSVEPEQEEDKENEEL